MILTIIAFLAVFGILVFVHELGHFFGAKIFGVKVQEFFFGFPPRLWAKKHNDVLYGLNAIPIGGYVKLLGEEGEESKSPESFVSKKPYQKIGILAAGVVMNLILAWVILTAFYGIGGPALLQGMWDHKGVENNQKVIITEVTKDTPAQKSGLKQGDQIVRVNGKNVFMTEEVTVAVSQAPVRDGHAKIKIETIRDGKTLKNDLTTYTDSFEENGKKYSFERIGVAMERTGVVKSIWYMAPIVAFQEIYRLGIMTFQALWEFLKTIFTQFKLSDQVGGVIAIAKVSGVTARMGFWAFAQFIAALSVTLAVINLLPIPAVDGGHILFVLLEKFTKKEISNELKTTINKVGFGLVLLIAAAYLYKDASRFGVIDSVIGVFKK